MLSDEFPKLMKEWDREKNQLDPSTITTGSNKEVWWICLKGHSWKKSIYNRTHYPNATCAKCKSFGFKQEELSDYSSKNIKSVYEIAEQSNKVVLWDCSICRGEYRRSPVFVVDIPLASAKRKKTTQLLK